MKTGMNKRVWGSGLVLSALALLSGPGQSQEVSRSTPETIALPPMDEGQLGESALEGLPRQSLTEGDFVEILVEPVFFSEKFAGPQSRHLIRYQQLQLLMQDQERREQLEPARGLPQIQFREDGRQASPGNRLRTQPQ